MYKNNYYKYSDGYKLDLALVNYVIYEGGTLAFDGHGNVIGNYPTESEAIEAVKELAEEFYNG